MLGGESGVETSATGKFYLGSAAVYFSQAGRAQRKGRKGDLGGVCSQGCFGLERGARDTCCWRLAEESADTALPAQARPVPPPTPESLRAYVTAGAPQDCRSKCRGHSPPRRNSYRFAPRCAFSPWQAQHLLTLAGRAELRVGVI